MNFLENIMDKIVFFFFNEDIYKRTLGTPGCREQAPLHTNYSHPSVSEMVLRNGVCSDDGRRI